MKLISNRYLMRRAAMLTLVGVLALSVLFALKLDGRQASAQSLSCEVSQITFTTSVLGPNSEPSISGDGARIAFVSNSDLTGGNADSNEEIFLYNTATNSFTQVTHTIGGSGSHGPTYVSR